MVVALTDNKNNKKFNKKNFENAINEKAKKDHLKRSTSILTI